MLHETQDDVYHHTMKIILILLTLIPTLVYAQTSVWKISKNNRHLFIGGTIHVLSKSDYPLPKAYDKAYNQAARIVLETDLSEANSPDFQSGLLNYFSYPSGKTLQSALKKQTYRKLQQYCKTANIPMSLLAPFRPQLVALMLTSMELQRLGVSSAGVDQIFNQMARADGKPVDQLETLEEQLRFLANMGLGQEDELILSTIKENQQLAEIMRFLLGAWRKGDVAALDKEIVQPMRQEFPSIYRDILATRNNNWMPHISAYLDTAEVEFILVGALHLVGDDGLLKQLERQGYSISQW